jgi:hypothetical protein
MLLTSVLQVQIREDFVLLEDVIGHQEPVEQVCLKKLPLLLVPGEKEEDLCLEGIPFRIPVEIPEKGVLLEFFEHDLGPEGFPQHLAQCGLANADASFDRDVPEVRTCDQIRERLLFGHRSSLRLVTD